MLRALAAVPVMMMALVPLPITTETPAAPPLPETTATLPSPADMLRPMADFQGLIDQQRQSRRALLAAITPEHRALLSRLVGAMAIADDPDEETAAAQLNAALSPAEKEAVIDTQAAQQLALSQRFAQMAAAQAQQIPIAQRPMPPPDGAGTHLPMLRGRVPQGQVIYGGSAGVMSASRFAGIDNDAGSILLRSAVSTLGVPKILMNSVMPMNGGLPSPTSPSVK